MDNNEFKSEFDGGLKNDIYETKKFGLRMIIFAFVLTVLLRVLLIL